MTQLTTSFVSIETAARRIAFGKVYVVEDPGDIIVEAGKVSATAGTYRIVKPTPEDLEAMEAGKRVTAAIRAMSRPDP